MSSPAPRPRRASRDWLLGLFAALALTLAAIGIYGVLAYLVSQRTREIGIRMAIGADRTAVLGLVVSARPVAGARRRRHRPGDRVRRGEVDREPPLPGTPDDPMTFIAVPAVLTLVALIASVVPARRAMRVDPITALRTE